MPVYYEDACIGTNTRLTGIRKSAVRYRPRVASARWGSVGDRYFGHHPWIYVIFSSRPVER